MHFSSILMLVTSTMITLTPFCSNPITLGVWMWLTSLFITLSISTFLSSWFAYLTFMIYLGGLLVMFAYFSALDPNQKDLSMKTPLTMLFLTTPILLILLKTFIALPTYPSMPTNYSHLHLFFLTPSTLTFFAIILFITMVVVAKIASPKYGPLRPFSNYV